MKTLHLIIITISCFCAVDFIFIQSNFFIPCGWQSVEQSTLHPVQCNDTVQILQSIFGMTASIGIASIVGITAFFSPKKSAILVGGVASLFVSFIVVYQIFFLSSSAIPPGIMIPMRLTDRVLTTFTRSPLWPHILAATIFSMIIWPIVVLRKKITGIFR